MSASGAYVKSFFPYSSACCSATLSRIPRQLLRRFFSRMASTAPAGPKPLPQSPAGVVCADGPLGSCFFSPIASPKEECLREPLHPTPMPSLLAFLNLSVPGI